MRSHSIPVTDPAAGLRLTEIFYSLQGEANDSGYPSVFVRLTGCPLRCHYCDTTYSFEGGQRQSLEQILQTVQQYNVKHVCVTGGEPLAQPNCIPLLRLLCEENYVVSLETSGALDIQSVDPRVSKVMDLKTPSSGEVERNLWENLKYLTKHDQIKFVISDRTDYDWAVQQLKQYQLQDIVGTVWFSPAFAIEKEQVKLPIHAKNLAEWIIHDRLPVRFQLQLHKLLWQDEVGK